MFAFLFILVSAVLNKNITTFNKHIDIVHLLEFADNQAFQIFIVSSIVYNRIQQRRIADDIFNFSDEAPNPMVLFSKYLDLVIQCPQ